MSAPRLISGLSLVLAVVTGLAAFVAVSRADAARDEWHAWNMRQAALAAAPVGEEEEDEHEVGLGERMNSFARRFAGLWFAGTSGNFELAEYELEEMEEVIEGIEPLNKVENGVVINGVLDALKNTQLKAMGEAVEAKDRHAFELAYRETMKACNACHTSSKHEFIRIAIPERKPVANRIYEKVEGAEPEVVKVSRPETADR